MQLLQIGSARTRGLSFTPDGAALFIRQGSASTVNRLCWWDLGAGRPLWECQILAPLGQTVVSTDHQWLAALDRGGGIPHLSRLSASGLTWLVLPNSSYTASLVLFLPDSRALAAVVSDYADGGYFWRAMFWDLPGVRARPPVTLGRSQVLSVVASPDGSRLAGVCAADGLERAIHLWELSRPGGVELSRHSSSLRLLLFAPDGSRLASVTGGRVDLLTVPAGERAVLRSGKPAVIDLAFTPDGRWLLLLRQDGGIETWDVASGARRPVIDFGASGLSKLAVAPDGLTAAVGGRRGRIVVWDLDL
jgi:WD40 repeat protein